MLLQLGATPYFQSEPHPNDTPEIWKSRQEALLRVYFASRPKSAFGSNHSPFSSPELPLLSDFHLSWNPNNRTNPNEPIIHGQKFFNEKSRRTKKQEHVLDSWLSDRGLLFHTFLLYFATNRFLTLTQAYLRTLPQKELSAPQSEVVSVSIPYEETLALLHDFGRNITHDPILHHSEQVRLFEKAGFHPNYYTYKEAPDLYDQPNLLTDHDLSRELGAMGRLRHFLDCCMKPYWPEEMDSLPTDKQGRSVRFPKIIDKALDGRQMAFYLPDPQFYSGPAWHDLQDRVALHLDIQFLTDPSGLALPQTLVDQFFQEVISQDFAKVDTLMSHFRDPIR